ncbi:MAG: ClbS/DfsB family four-helix bundle protein [Chloroflexota bacterium]|nr:ClbS/DfsB family four-helix bundle protein [Chloroflexota bacterium]
MTEQWMPGSKAELMTEIRGEWQKLMDVVDKLDEQKMTAPDDGGWSPKDNLAHLSEWMNLLMGYHMDKRPSHEVFGVPEDVTRGWDMEVINPVLFERNKDRSTDEVLIELRKVYEMVLAKLDATPFEDLLQPRHADDPERRPLLLWVLGDTSEHFAEHREVIERAL